jgi:putative flavoprotein involved in K+ transport
MTKVWDAIVIGGGQAGLATGYNLRKQGLRYLILEAAEQAVGSWTKYYEVTIIINSCKIQILKGI